MNGGGEASFSPTVNFSGTAHRLTPLLAKISSFMTHTVTSMTPTHVPPMCCSPAFDWLLNSVAVSSSLGILSCSSTMFVVISACPLFNFLLLSCSTLCPGVFLLPTQLCNLLSVSWNVHCYSVISIVRSLCPGMFTAALSSPLFDLCVLECSLLLRHLHCSISVSWNVHCCSVFSVVRFFVLAFYLLLHFLSFLLLLLLILLPFSWGHPSFTSCSSFSLSHSPFLLRCGIPGHF